MTLGVGSRDVYREDFEKPFLEQSADFYRVWFVSLLYDILYGNLRRKLEATEKCSHDSNLKHCQL